MYENLTIAGFKPYTFRGNITTVDGGWTAHSWIGIDIGKSLYFLDPFMSASGNKGYFLFSQKSATVYDLKNTQLWQCDVGLGLVASVIPLSELDTDAKRSKYPPVLDIYAETDWTYNTFKHLFAKGQAYEGYKYMTTKDKHGNVVLFYSNGKRIIETEKEYEQRREEEFEEWDRNEARKQWNTNQEWVEKWGMYDEVFDENGNKRNP